MPEGHSIHRYARLQTADLVGPALSVSSPQGRFVEGARLLDGQRLDHIDAVGKHLFYHWADGHILHVHLGLFGLFRLHSDPGAEPTDGTRLAMISDAAAVHLSGPTACSLLTPEEKDQITDRLGPDPLRARASFDQFREGLVRRKVPLAAALLDQRVIAGIGNVYRAELPFLAGFDPHRPANSLDATDCRQIWDLARTQLRRGEKAGRIVTVEPADVGATRRSQLDDTTRLYVYKRQGEPCRRCDTPIALGEVANRKLWWCPSCQTR